VHNTEHLHPLGESHHHPGPAPYWEIAHHNWRFWLGLIAIFVAIAVYVGTNDLSMVPLGRHKHLAQDVSRVPSHYATSNYLDEIHRLNTTAETLDGV
jgi:hypothetical protein